MIWRPLLSPDAAYHAAPQIALVTGIHMWSATGHDRPRALEPRTDKSSGGSACRSRPSHSTAIPVRLHRPEISVATKIWPDSAIILTLIHQVIPQNGDLKHRPDPYTVLMERICYLKAENLCPVSNIESARRNSYARMA
jgi:hypothetical protein